VIEVYAITDHPAPPLADTEALAAGTLAAVCAPAGVGQVSPEALWRHEQVVEALMEAADVLPVRYGMRFDDPTAVRAVVERRHDELVAALNRVRGAIELSVRVVADGAPSHSSTPASGTEYLRAKSRGALVARAVHEPLSELARATVSRHPRRPGEVLTAAYLVDRGAASDFAQRVARIQDAHPELRLLCTGPWPPYSFAEP
jgi:hypothetical protein